MSEEAKVRLIELKPNVRLVVLYKLPFFGHVQILNTLEK